MKNKLYIMGIVAVVAVVAIILLLPKGTVEERGDEKQVRFGGTSEISVSRHPLTETFVVEKIVDADVATGIDFAPDGRMFFVQLGTDKIKTIINGNVKDFAKVPDSGIPSVEEGESGLLSIELDPNFTENGFVYVYYASNGTNKIGRFVETDGIGTDFKIIFDGISQGKIHNGGKLQFGPDSKLYLSVGDGYEKGQTLGEKNPAQDASSLNGKILRLNSDGSMPDDNPVPGAYTYAYGFRNPFGYDFHPTTGKIFAEDNGIDCCDELNVIEPGKNYGWPLEMGFVENGRYAQPIYAWGDVDRVAPTRLAFFNSTELYMGTWRTREIYHFTLSSENIIKVETFVLGDLPPPLTGAHAGEVHEGADPRGGVSEIVLGPDGNLYFSDRAAVYRLVKK